MRSRSRNPAREEEGAPSLCKERHVFIVIEMALLSQYGITETSIVCELKLC